GGGPRGGGQPGGGGPGPPPPRAPRGAPRARAGGGGGAGGARRGGGGGGGGGLLECNQRRHRMAMDVLRQDNRQHLVGEAADRRALALLEIEGGEVEHGDGRLVAESAVDELRQQRPQALLGLVATSGAARDAGLQPFEAQLRTGIAEQLIALAHAVEEP